LSMSATLLGGKRCLVLDDEILIALDIQQTLESAGAEHVACVTTAPEALALLRNEPGFDFAVLDVKLSGLDSNSLGIAALLTEKSTPFIFLTGMRVDDVHAAQFPQAPVIEKPYDTTTLLDAVRRALNMA
jgi:CheY-like chemotaxis protein